MRSTISTSASCTWSFGLSAGAVRIDGRLDADLQRAAAGFLDARQLEFHPLLVAIGRQRDALLAFDAPRFRTAGDLLSGGPRSQFDLSRSPGEAVRGKIGRDDETIARINSHRRREIGDFDVRRTAIGAEADRINGNAGFLRRFDGGRRIEAGVLLAVGQQDDARDRLRAMVGDQLPQSFAEASFGAVGFERGGPIDFVLFGLLRVGRLCRAGFRPRRRVEPEAGTAPIEQHEQIIVGIAEAESGERSERRSTTAAVASIAAIQPPRRPASGEQITDRRQRQAARRPPYAASRSHSTPLASGGLSGFVGLGRDGRCSVRFGNVATRDRC